MVEQTGCIVNIFVITLFSPLILVHVFMPPLDCSFRFFLLTCWPSVSLLTNTINTFFWPCTPRSVVVVLYLIDALRDE